MSTSKINSIGLDSEKKTSQTKMKMKMQHQGQDKIKGIN